MLTQVLTYQQKLITERGAREKVVEEANKVADKIKSVLSYGLSATRTLAFVVEKYGTPDDFNSISQNILQSNPFIDAVELTRKGIITHVYPLEGNEKAIGLDVLADMRLRKEALKALKDNKLFFAGPFELKQGGVAIVGRLPIYRDSEFWGFSVVIIRFSTLLKATGIIEDDNNPFAYQLSKINPTTGKEEFFLHGVVPEAHEYISVQVPDGQWNLYVMQKTPTANFSVISPIALLGLLLAATSGMFAWDLARQPRKLRTRITEATNAMQRVSRLYHFSSQVNRMAVHATDETQMYSEACRIAVETGMYKMAWIGSINESDQLTKFVAGAGMEKEYVEEVIPISLGAEYPDPFARMIRSNTFVYCNNLASEPQKKQWVERALSYGFNAIILLPFRRSGKIIGSFNLYSLEKDPFDEHEIRLLQETAETISYVLEYFEREKGRVQAEQQVQKEKILSDSIINSMPGVFYFYNRQGKFLRWNKNFEIVSGYSYEEVQNMHPLDFFEGDGREIVEAKIANVFQSGEDDVIANFVTKDSRKIPYYFNGKKVTFGDHDFLIGMGLDISDRVVAENVLRQRNEEIEKLSAHLQNVREEERSRIALEIHDVLGQQLTAIKMDATWIRKKSTQEQAVVERITTMIGLVDDTIKTVRRISSELRPGILDDLGLVAALEWQGSEFEKNSGIHVHFKSNISEVDLPRDFATNVFRIFQEALTNVARHSEATVVDASFTQDSEGLRLVVKDNGVGIHLNEIKNGRSIGLISMKERARIFNGEVVVGNNVPSGTVVTLTVEHAKNKVTL